MYIPLNPANTFWHYNGVGKTSCFCTFIQPSLTFFSFILGFPLLCHTATAQCPTGIDKIQSTLTTFISCLSVSSVCLSTCLSLPLLLCFPDSRWALSPVICDSGTVYESWHARTTNTPHGFSAVCAMTHSVIFIFVQYMFCYTIPLTLQIVSTVQWYEGCSSESKGIYEFASALLWSQQFPWNKLILVWHFLVMNAGVTDYSFFFKEGTSVVSDKTNTSKHVILLFPAIVEELLNLPTLLADEVDEQQWLLAQQQKLRFLRIDSPAMSPKNYTHTTNLH